MPIQRIANVLAMAVILVGVAVLAATPSVVTSYGVTEYRLDKSDQWQLKMEDKTDKILSAVTSLQSDREYTRWIGGLTLTAVLAYMVLQFPSLRRGRSNGSSGE